MLKLTNSHYDDAMAYALLEPEFNLFLIGDLENYGLESENVSLYTADTWAGGALPYLILDYRNNFLFYSHTADYNKEEVAGFLSGHQMRNLSGKRELIEPLIPLLKGLELVPTYLSRLDRPAIPDDPSFQARRLTPDDVGAIYGLLNQIEEFFTMRTKSEEENREDILNSITKEGRMYGVFENGTLAAAAGTSAENSMSAMVVSVATLPEYRGRGYATRLVTRLCQECLDEGMKFLCLFYDNPEAGAIYRKIGFKEMGQYAMVRSVDTDSQTAD